MAKPTPFSTQEIDDSILDGFAQFQEDQTKIKQLLGAADDMAILGAVWRKMGPEAKGYIQRTNPDLHRQATSMFGQ